MTTVMAQHPAMLHFRPDPDQRSDVIAYLQRLGP
jgi:hypothetical protein